MNTIISGDPKRPRGFFYWGLFCLLVSVIAFVPSYWQPLVSGEYVSPSRWLSWHAFSTLLWVVLLVSQPLLILRRKVALHRAFGALGVVTAIAVIVTAVVVQLDVMAAYQAAGDVGNGTITPFFRFLTLIMFTGFIGFAIIKKSKTDWHKRFMILGTLALMEAAFARVFANMLGLPDIAGPLSGVTHAILVVLFLFWDRLAFGRFHPATVWGAVISIVVMFGLVPVAGSDWWGGIAANIAGSG